MGTAMAAGPSPVFVATFFLRPPPWSYQILEIDYITNHACLYPHIPLICNPIPFSPLTSSFLSASLSSRYLLYLPPFVSSCLAVAVSI